MSALVGVESPGRGPALKEVGGCPGEVGGGVCDASADAVVSAMTLDMCRGDHQM